MKKQRNMALSMIRNYFPKVNKVVDAKKALALEITDADSVHSDVRTHRTCALAVCAKRVTKADGVIVGLATTYIIHGPIATRYKNGPALSREITAFDRRAGFATGRYQLTPFPPSKELGTEKPTGPKDSSGKPKRFRHITKGVRTVLGHKEEVA